jgi:hypothetical protein
VRTSSDGGATWDSGVADYAYYWSGKDTSNNAFNGNNTAAQAEIASSIGSAANEDGAGGTLRLSGPHLTKRTIGNHQLGYTSNSDRGVFVTGGFMRMSSADVDGVQLFFSSGNIASGTIVFRGIK